MNTITICPKCESDELYACKRGYSLKKGVVGTLLVGGLGLMGGLMGANKIVYNCLKCGHVFSPGRGGIKINNQQTESKCNYTLTEEIKQNYVELPQVITQMNTEILVSHDAQRGVKKPLAYSNHPRPQQNTWITNEKIVCSCGNRNEQRFIYCRCCGTKIDRQVMNIVRDRQIFIYENCTVCHKETAKISRKSQYCVNCGVLLYKPRA